MLDLPAERNRPLGGRPLVRTRSPRVIRDTVDSLTNEHHELALLDGASLNGSADGIQLGPLGLVHVAYGAQVTVDSPPSARQVVIVLPLGPMGVASNGHRWVAREPFALSTVHSTLMAPDPWAGALVGSVDAECLEDYLETLQQRPLQAPLSLTSERPLRLASPGLVEAAWLEACRVLSADAAPPDEITVRALVSSLLSTMTLGLAPHLSGTLAPASLDAPGRGPDYLRAARRLMEEHCADDLTLDAVATAVGVSARQLRAAFAEHLGTTPGRMLRGIRLDRARALLLDRTRADRLTVAAAAALAGFSHLGRFAAAYAERYGEHPSDTLARARS